MFSAVVSGSQGAYDPEFGASPAVGNGGDEIDAFLNTCLPGEDADDAPVFYGPANAEEDTASELGLSDAETICSDDGTESVRFRTLKSHSQ